VTQSRLALSLAVACLLAPALSAQELSLKAFGGWCLSPAGDLSASIGGWRDYYGDRASGSFSSSFDWKEMGAAPEAGIELEAALSPRLSFGLSVGVIPGVTSGTISTESATVGTTALSAAGSRTVTVEETTARSPRAELTTVPVLITAYYRFNPGDRLCFVAGAGGGAYFGRYSYSERYAYDFSSVEDLVSDGETSRYVDRSSTAGEYFEEAQNINWGLHGLVGLEYRLSDNLGAVFEVVGRWLTAGPWKGSKSDEYDWSHTWGPWGGYADSGEVTEASDGELWSVGAVSDATGKAYPRLVFSEAQPAGSGHASVRRADLGLGGVTFRLGVRIRFGGRR
jgi:Outer membrane protein beta-barrel domain